jgi:hypothetical protein
MHLYTEATLESEYPHLHPSINDPTPEYQGILEDFRNQYQGFMPGSDWEEDLGDAEGRPPAGAYFHGFCGRLFGNSPQLRADFDTHNFQRQLNAERLQIRQRRERQARVLELYHNHPVGLPAQWDVLDKAGITAEDIDEFYARSLWYI